MKISIFIPSYNQKAYLNEAIESALCQTLRPAQIIVVDDCSTDGSQELILAYHRKYPRLIDPIFHDSNTGVTKGRVDALHAVSSDYVTYMDGDDRFDPLKLEKEAATMKANPDVDIVYSNNRYMADDGRYLWTWIDGDVPPEGDVFCETFSRDFPRRSLFRMELVNYRAWRKIGFHDLNLRLYEDFDMRIRLTKRLKVAYCDHPLSAIRLHGTGLSSSALGHHFRSLDYIYQKNRHLLSDIAWRDRVRVERGFTSWMAQIGIRGALASLMDKDIGRFLRLSASSFRRHPGSCLSTVAQFSILGCRRFGEILKTLGPRGRKRMEAKQSRDS